MKENKYGGGNEDGNKSDVFVGKEMQKARIMAVQDLEKAGQEDESSL